MEPEHNNLFQTRIFPPIKQFETTEISNTDEQPQSYEDENEEPLQRCPHACTPCRRSKVKCDGLLPCDTCKKRRSKPRCTYRPRQLKFIAVKPAPNIETTARQDLPSFHRQDLHGQHSLALLIEQFKRLVSPLQSTPLDSAIGRCDGRDAFDAGTRDAANMSRSYGDANQPNGFGFSPVIGQSLPQKPPESTPLELDRFYRSAVSVQQNMNSGKPFDAWLNMPGLVRQAELSFLQVNQSDAVQLNYWRQIWWITTGLDVQINILIGRRTAIPANYVIQRPLYEHSSPKLRRFEKSCLDFQQYALPILDQLSRSDSGLTDTTDYETLLPLANLEGLRQIMNNIRELSSQAKQDRTFAISIANHHLEVHCFHLMLCCLLAGSKQRQAFLPSQPQEPCSTQPFDGSVQSPKHHSAAIHDAVYEYRTEILESCRSIVSLTRNVTDLERSNQNCNWVRYFIAYTAVSILGIESLCSGTTQHSGLATIYAGRKMFEHLSASNPQFEFAHIASRRIRDLWSEIRAMEKIPSTQSHVSAGTTQQDNQRKRGSTSTTSPAKRTKTLGSFSVSVGDATETPIERHILSSQPQATIEPVSHYPHRHPPEQEQLPLKPAVAESGHHMPPPVVHHPTTQASRPPSRAFDPEPPSITFNKQNWNGPSTLQTTYVSDVDYQSYFAPSGYPPAPHQYWDANDLMLQQQDCLASGFSTGEYGAVSEAFDWDINGMGEKFYRPIPMFYAT